MNNQLTPPKQLQSLLLSVAVLLAVTAEAFAESTSDGQAHPANRAIVQAIEASAEPLPDIEDEAFAGFIDRFADARVVLLGEESHGTDEFYRARAEITTRLVEEHGFTVVAFEADWPDGARMDAYVRGHTPVAELIAPELRFPEWMWRNHAVEDFLEDMRQLNAELGSVENQAGIYGLDLYGIGGSIDAVVHFLERYDAKAAESAQMAYSCLAPLVEDPYLYNPLPGPPGSTTCSEGAENVLQDLRGQHIASIKAPEVASFSAWRNAQAVVAAEAYYRSMSEGSVASWNARDRHMFETLLAILAERGESAKAVVWAHNSHVGDASATQMGSRGEINIGQLAREHFGDDAVLIGFGTDQGTVTAATDWDGSAETMQVQSAQAGSVGELFRDAEPDRLLLDLRNAEPDLLAALTPRRIERFIGVQYLPRTERWSHYAEASLAEQFDAYVWLEHTRAVEPLAAAYLESLPQSHPFALPLENVGTR